MKNILFQNSSSSLKFVISIGVIILSTLIFTFLGTILYAVFIDSSIFTNYDLLMSDYSNPATISFLKITQIFQSIGLFVFPPFLLAFLFSNKMFKYLGFSNNINMLALVLSGAVMILALPFINFTAEINQALVLPDSLSWLEQMMRDSEKNAERITKIFLDIDSVGSLLVNILMMALIPAIGEELMFRGLIQKSLSKKMNIHIAIFISAFIFSFIHFQFFGFLPRFLMGLFFGYVFYWSGNLWLTIFAHFVNNGSAVLLAYVYGVDGIATDTSTFSEGDNYSMYLISSIIITSGLIYSIYFLSKQGDNGK